MTEPEVSTKFVELFKAEKILDKNWEIDLCERLDSYLAHLDSIDGGVKRRTNRKRRREEMESGDEDEDPGDNGEEDDPDDRPGSLQNRINFAEAAAVIQGCAEIYGKKVDYVYQRTMKFQNLIAAGQEAPVEKKAGRRERADEFRRKFKTIADRDCEILDFDLLERSKRKPLSINTRTVEQCWDSRLETGKRKTTLLAKLLMEFVPLRPDEKRELAVHCGSKNQDIFGNADDFKVNRLVGKEISGAMLLRVENDEFMNEFTDPEKWHNHGSEESPSASLMDLDIVDMNGAENGASLRFDPRLSDPMLVTLQNYKNADAMHENWAKEKGEIEEPNITVTRAASLPAPTIELEEPLSQPSQPHVDIFAILESTEDSSYKRRQQKVTMTFTPAEKEMKRRDVLIKVTLMTEVGERRSSDLLLWEENDGRRTCEGELQPDRLSPRNFARKSISGKEVHEIADRAPYLSDPMLVTLQKCISKVTKARQARKKNVDAMHENWAKEKGEIEEPSRTVTRAAYLPAPNVELEEPLSQPSQPQVDLFAIGSELRPGHPERCRRADRHGLR
ncbi:hypothetical protein L596_027771 [Steinernema carpocapsae]|uniref:Condensin II complex subunit H2 N-terminal domain-containing protein n=1 Tax=Steinernema carpocapsae TaxID=34508 RepID=A0A4U5LWF8_STECR|nr:hypothetical protein L596_027771 [Steinernema carpocapsae]